MQRREVRGLADDRLLLRRAFADQAADRRQPGGDLDPRLERDGFVRLTYRGQKSSKLHARSHCGHRIPPFARRLGSKDPQR
jgi:hypothetical protein